MGLESTGTFTALSGTSTSVPIPAHSSGQLLCLIVGATRSTTPMEAAPALSGWTGPSPTSEAGNASAVRLAFYYKYGNGSETSVTVGTWSASVGGYGQVLALNGRASSSPVDDSDITQQDSGTDIDSPAGTASTDDVDVVWGFIFDDDISTEADHDSDAGWQGTSQGYGEDSTPGNGFAGAVSYVNLDTGTIPASTYSSNNDSDAGVAGFIAFLPGAAGTAVTDVDSDYGAASDEFDTDENSLDINGSDLNTADVYLSADSTLAGGSTEIDISAAIQSNDGSTINLDLTDLTTELADIEALLVSDGHSLFLIVDAAAGEASIAVTVHRAKAFNMAASANITASGENTTAQLTAPSGKTTGDFGGGRIQDDENPGDTVDLGADEYREDEWSIAAVDPPDGTYSGAQSAETYQFRVLIDGVVVDTYTVTPEWTIGVGAQPLVGTLFVNTPNFFTGVIAPGAVDLAGSLFVNTPSYPTGAIAPGAVDLAGSLFTNTPSFPTGLISPGPVSLVGFLFTNTPNFFTGVIAPGAVALAGSLFVNTPSFFVGVIALDTGQTLTGSLFVNTESFPTGLITPGDVDLAGSLLVNTPNFFTGAIDALYALTGSLFVNTPSFPTGVIDALYALTGSLFTNTPSFPTGAITVGPTDLAGSLFVNTASFPTGAITTLYALTGSLFTNTPSFPTGAVDALYDLVGSLFSNTPTFPTGDVVGAVNLAGSLFSNTPSFPTGLITPGPVALTGSLYVHTSSFYPGVILVILAYGAETTGISQPSLITDGSSPPTPALSGSDGLANTGRSSGQTNTGKTPSGL